MHAERQEDLNSLVNLGLTCKKIRQEVRRIMYHCIRIDSVKVLNELPEYDWTGFVK